MRNIAIIILSFILSFSLVAQNYQLNESESEVYIEGTSTLHDWKSDVEDFDVSTELSENQLLNTVFTARVKSIKSGKGGMDKNTYNAMDADKYPEIKFTAEKLDITGAQITGSGQLTISGVTNTVPLVLNVESWEEGSYHIYGSVVLKMTDYGIDPPKAMLGTIKTGDEVTIGIDINISK